MCYSYAESDATRRAFFRLVINPWSLYQVTNHSVRPSTVSWRRIVNFTVFFTLLILAMSSAIGQSGETIWSSWLSLASLEEYSYTTFSFIHSPSGAWVTFPLSPVKMGWLYLGLLPFCLGSSTSVSISSPLDEELVLTSWCVDMAGVFDFLAVCLVLAIRRQQSSDWQKNVRLKLDPLRSLFILPGWVPWVSNNLIVC